MAGKFEITKDKAGKYRFRLKAGNGEIIAVSEAYETKVSAKNGNNVSRANAVSPDGHLLIVPDEESNNADLIDLSQRKMIATVTYAPGRPRFAFSALCSRKVSASVSPPKPLRP